MMITHTHFRVRYSETDGQRRAHHSHYPVWFEMGRADFCRNIGFNYKKLEDEGSFLVVAKLECAYKTPLEYDDPVTVETTLSTATRKVLTFKYRVVNERTGTVAGEGQTVLVCIDREGRPSPLPSSVLQTLKDASSREFEHAMPHHETGG
jgi:acyl-CoA thioester hydrolase